MKTNPKRERQVLASETLARSVADIMTEKRGFPVVVFEENGKWIASNLEEDYEGRTPVKPKTSFKSNPHGKATNLKSIVKYLNGLSKKEILELAKKDSVPMNRKLSLMVFIRDWRMDDPTHEEYLRGIAEGHSTDEALQAGDLLNFLMVGGKELRLYDGG